MEADAIAEGFAKSIEMHGLIFNKRMGKNNNLYSLQLILINKMCNQIIYIYILTGDSDSSVCKRLYQTLPYGPKLLVDKIECRNHILQNLGQKMSQIVKKTKYPIYLNNLIN